MNESIAHDLEPIRRRVRFLNVRFGVVVVQVPSLVGLNVLILLDQHPHDALVERLVRRKVVANVDVDRARDVGDRVVLRQDLGAARQVEEGELLRRRRWRWQRRRARGRGAGRDQNLAIAPKRRKETRDARGLLVDLIEIVVVDPSVGNLELVARAERSQCVSVHHDLGRRNGRIGDRVVQWLGRIDVQDVHIGHLSVHR